MVVRRDLPMSTLQKLIIYHCCWYLLETYHKEKVKTGLRFLKFLQLCCEWHINMEGLACPCVNPVVRGVVGAMRLISVQIFYLRESRTTLKGLLEISTSKDWLIHKLLVVSLIWACHQQYVSGLQCSLFSIFWWLQFFFLLFYNVLKVLYFFYNFFFLILICISTYCVHM